MPDELSRYQQHCEKVCQLCSLGLGFYLKAERNPRLHWSVVNQDTTPCTAPTLSDWAESESRRADSAEASRDCSNENYDRLRLSCSEVERERDSLKAQLAGAE